MVDVTIIVPVYNAQGLVGDALISLLQQAGPTYEIVVVDDGSTDGTVDDVLAFADERVRLIRASHRGISSALNLGLSCAKGRILMRCDADDRYPLGRLAWQVAWLDENAEFGAILGDVNFYDEDWNPWTRSVAVGNTSTEVTSSLRSGNVEGHFNSYAIRTELIRMLGGWREYFVTSEDIDLMFRISEITRVMYCPIGCYDVRLRRSSVTHTHRIDYTAFYFSQALLAQKQRISKGWDDVERGCATSPTEKDARETQPLLVQISDIMIGYAWKEFSAGNHWRAMRASLRSCMNTPFRIKAWMSLVILTSKCVRDPLTRVTGKP